MRLDFEKSIKKLVVFWGKWVVLAVLISVMGCRPEEKPLQLVHQGQSPYQIVIPTNASPSTRHASQELQAYLREISGVVLPIVTEKDPASKYQILIGKGERVRKLLKKQEIDWNELGDEGFAIWTRGNHLIIAGGDLRGTLYGVYTFLEEVLGCRWWSSDAQSYPRTESISFQPLRIRQRPAFEYREVFFFDARDNNWAARNKINGFNAQLNELQGGKFPWAFPHFHTFDWVLPEGKYFKQHPEYFAWVENNRRSPVSICYSSTGAVLEATANVKEWMRKNPDKRIFSVSQRDWPYRCGCAGCAQLDAKYGCPMGSMLTFVNKIAEGVAGEFPQNYVQTLAYDYSMKAPNGLRPATNVLITVATMTGGWEKEVQNWTRLTDKVYLWDYMTGFSHFLVPFPNREQLESYAKFYRQHGVKGVLSQGNYQDPGGDFPELKAWLLAKLFWNPDFNVPKGIDEFFEGYYQSAAEPMRQYFDLMHKHLKEPDPEGAADKRYEAVTKGWWLRQPVSNYLNQKAMKEYQSLFDRAEILASKDPVLLLRVQKQRLNLYTMELAALPKDDYRRASIIKKYLDICARAKIHRYGEFKSLAEAKAAF